MKKGILYAIAAYGSWAILPLYWKALDVVPALQIMTHRVVWSFGFLAILVTLRRGWPELRRALTPRTLMIYSVAGVLLGANWLLYIWGVNSGFVIETSLGYFINPLVSVLLGVIFLREKLPTFQWIPVGIAAAGVVYLTFNYGSLPWISLALAITFGLYGLVKKLAPLGSLEGLTLETAILFLPALAYLGAADAQGVGAFGRAGSAITLLLAAAGVITALPLLFFAAAARRIPLYLMGILQYFSPSIQFLLGLYVFHEAFSPSRLVGFSLIWLALLIYSLYSLRASRQSLAIREEVVRG